MSIIPVAGPLTSPIAQLASACNTSTDTSAEVTNLTAFSNVSAGELGVVVFCVDEFRSKTSTDYEVLSYTGKLSTSDELTGLVSRAGVSRNWAADTYCASFGTGFAWERMRTAVASLDREWGAL